MADRVFVPVATVLAALQRRAGVLQLSEDLALAGRWKHGWVPLDAVAAAIKAKKYHAGGGHGRMPKISGELPRTVRTPKGRGGEAVMARREVSRGRVKGALPTGGRRKASAGPPVGSKLEHHELRLVTPGKANGLTEKQAFRMKASELRGHADRGDAAARAELSRRAAKRGEPAARWRPANNGSGKRMHFLISSDESLPVEHRYHYGSDGRLVRFASHEAAQKAADRLHAKGHFPGQAPAGKPAVRRAQEVAQDRTRQLRNAQVAKDEGAALQGEGGPRRESHISAKQLTDGRTKLTDSRSGESVNAVHLASFHSQGHTITGVRGGLMHTRDDSGVDRSYDPATGRAAVSRETSAAATAAVRRVTR